MSDDTKTHTPPLHIEGFGVGTKAQWSLNPEGKLLVLVHGFMGSAVGTWAGLPYQLCLQNVTRGYDVVLFGYESVTLTAEASANDLQTFLNGLLFNNAELVNRSVEELQDQNLRRKEGWVYKQMVLVGHSLGACVIRRAILNQLQGGERKWPEKTKLIWYAPAHRGAIAFRLLPAVALGLPGLLALAKPTTYFAPVLHDLKEDSIFLKNLLAETKELCDANEPLKAPVTFWARKDKVVVNGQFAKDRSPFLDIPGVSHTSICKPQNHDVTVSHLLKELES